MGITTPTRKPYHTASSALWASSATGADVESVPSNSAIVNGAAYGTGLTSARYNWLVATISEWFVLIRDSLFPQHANDGGHYEVDITGASGNSKLKIYGTSGEAGTTPLIIGYDDEGTPSEVFSVHKDGDASFTGDLTAVTLAAGDITGSGTVLGAVVSQTSGTETYVMPGVAGILISAGTRIELDSSVGYDDNDATVRKIRYHLPMPYYGTLTEVKVVTSHGNAANNVDAVLYSSGTAVSYAVTNHGAITAITGVTGDQSANVALSGTLTNAGQRGWYLDVELTNSAAQQVQVSKVVYKATVTRLGG